MLISIKNSINYPRSLLKQELSLFLMETHEGVWNIENDLAEFESEFKIEMK